MLLSQSELSRKLTRALFRIARYILAPSYAMLGCCASSSFLARTSHVNVSATSLSLVCTDPEDPDETRRECYLRRLNRAIKLAEDFGLALGILTNIFFALFLNISQISSLDFPEAHTYYLQKFE